MKIILLKVLQIDFKKEKSTLNRKTEGTKSIYNENNNILS